MTSKKTPDALDALETWAAERADYYHDLCVATGKGPRPQPLTAANSDGQATAYGQMLEKIARLKKQAKGN